MLAADQVSGLDLPGDGAAALVLKRLDDALRDGDRVYAVLLDATTSTVRSIGPADPDEAALSSHGTMGSVSSVIGRTGSATGLAAIVRAALCLYQQIIPSQGPDARNPGGPQFWLRNRIEGPRRAELHTFGLGGTCHKMVLEAIEDDLQPREVLAIERAQPLGARRLALFALEADDREGLLGRAGELIALADEDPDAPIERLARRWWHESRLDPSLRLAVIVIAESISSLGRGLDRIVRTLAEGQDLETAAVCEFDLQVIPPRLTADPAAQVAFVYPGLGNVFAGMGKELSALWPEICRARICAGAPARPVLTGSMVEIWPAGTVGRSPRADSRPGRRQQPCHRGDGDGGRCPGRGDRLQHGRIGRAGRAACLDRPRHAGPRPDELALVCDRACRPVSRGPTGLEARIRPNPSNGLP